MRTFTRMAVLPAALLALAACSRGAKRTAASSDSDLNSDLKLASTSLALATTRPSNIVLSPVEEMPLSKPEHAHVLRKAAGPKAVRSSHPTVKASPTTEVAAAEPKPQVEETVKAPAPQPEVTPPEPALPPAARPAPSPAPSQDPGTGRAQGQGQGEGVGTGAVLGAVLGGILGAVIRGGAVDGDHCEPHGGRHGRGGVWGGGVYQGGGGMGGGRNWPPINPMAGSTAGARF